VDDVDEKRQVKPMHKISAGRMQLKNILALQCTMGVESTIKRLKYR